MECVVYPSWWTSAHVHEWSILPPGDLRFTYIDAVELNKSLAQVATIVFILTQTQREMSQRNGSESDRASTSRSVYTAHHLHDRTYFVWVKFRNPCNHIYIYSVCWFEWRFICSRDVRWRCFTSDRWSIWISHKTHHCCDRTADAHPWSGQYTVFFLVCRQNMIIIGFNMQVRRTTMMDMRHTIR